MWSGAVAERGRGVLPKAAPKSKSSPPLIKALSSVGSAKRLAGEARSDELGDESRSLLESGKYSEGDVTGEALAADGGSLGAILRWVGTAAVVSGSPAVSPAGEGGCSKGSLSVAASKGLMSDMSGWLEGSRARILARARRRASLW